MSFLDAFQGYHQIPPAVDNQEKIAFITPIGNYHYKVMPFGLKNAGSTYQRMMTRMFELQMGKNIEVYIENKLAFLSHGEVVSSQLERTLPDQCPQEPFPNPRNLPPRIIPHQSRLGMLIAISRSR